MQHVRDVTDPEHPYTLEQLKVVNEDAITVNDEEGIVRYPPVLAYVREQQTQLHALAPSKLFMPCLKLPECLVL